MKYLTLSLLSAMVFALQFVPSRQSINCESNWIYFNETDSCYYIGSDKNWDSAEANCVSLSAHLASIENDLENTFVASLIEKDKNLNDGQMTWIGLRYQQNKWTWADGSTITYMNWMKGSPKEDASKYACVGICEKFIAIHKSIQILQDNYKGSKMYWNNVECGTIMRKYVCKQPADTFTSY